MRHFSKWVVVLLVPAIWVATARSQEQIVPTGTTVKLLLLRQKSVQKELKIGADKAKKISEFTNKQSEAARKASGMGVGKVKKAFAKLTKENKQFLASTLTEKQNKRLDQITMQFAALTLLTSPPMAKKLSLTEAQREKLGALQKKARKELVDLLTSKDREGINAKFAKLRDKASESILALLTDDQKTKVRELAGPPFKGEIVFEEAPSRKKPK